MVNLNHIGVRMINMEFYPLLGGAQMHTLRLCRYLKQQGIHAEVITRQHPGLACEEEIDGIPVYRTPILHRSKIGASLSFTVFSLRRLIADRKRYNIIHSHEMLSPMTVGLIGRQMLPTRLIINPHRGGYLGDVYKLQQRRKMTGGLRMGWARRKGDAFIAISQEIARELKSAGIAEEKIHIIPTTLDTDHFRPPSAQKKASLREQFGWDGGTWVCFDGRLVPEKGLDVLLESWRRVVQQSPTARLAIIGDGEERTRLEKLAADYQLGQHVQFISTVPDTAPYLQASDLYVQPSFTEGLPIAVLEAMSCGLPVVATAVGGVTDLMQNGVNGRVVPPKDANALAESLLDLITHPTLSDQLGGNARQDVVAYCAIEKVGQAHIALYKELSSMSDRP